MVAKWAFMALTWSLFWLNAEARKGEWEGPYIIIADEGLWPKVATHTSSEWQVSHHLYCNHTDRSLYYLQTDSIGSRKLLRRIDDSEPQCEFSRAKIIRSWHSSVYVVYERPRDVTLPEYCYRDPRTCLEIFFAESHNNGVTWTSPVRISRANMSDHVARAGVQLLIDEETNRLWLFYCHADMPTLKYSLSYVTRPNGSSIFSSEASFLPEVPNKWWLQFYSGTIQRIDGQTYIHLIVGYDGFHFSLLSSRDGALSWRMAEVKSFDFGFDLTTVNNGTASLLVMHISNKQWERDYHVKVSHDSGLTWFSVYQTEHPMQLLAGIDGVTKSPTVAMELMSDSWKRDVVLLSLQGLKTENIFCAGSHAFYSTLTIDWSRSMAYTWLYDNYQITTCTMFRNQYHEEVYLPV